MLKQFEPRFLLTEKQSMKYLSHLYQAVLSNISFQLSSGILHALTLLLSRIEQLLLLHRALWQLRQRTENC